MQQTWQADHGALQGCSSRPAPSAWMRTFCKHILCSCAEQLGVSEQGKPIALLEPVGAQAGDGFEAAGHLGSYAKQVGVKSGKCEEWEAVGGVGGSVKSGRQGRLGLQMSVAMRHRATWGHLQQYVADCMCSGACKHVSRWTRLSSVGGKGSLGWRWLWS